MADSHYEVDVMRGEMFVPFMDQNGNVWQFPTRQKADNEARAQASVFGHAAKVVLVKTIRSVLVAYQPKAVKP